MATRIRTVDFLPEIFRTSTNKQFLGATLDQLVQDPKLKPTQGYIGRHVGPGVNPSDSYVLEPTKIRTDYQLEPGVVTLLPNTNTVDTAITYPGLVDSINVKGGITDRADRLFDSEYYSWDPFVDTDKFVNFSQYYWLPNGPNNVDVYASTVPLTDNFVVTRGTNAYTFSEVSGNNPTLTLVRQGSYTFDVAQNGHKFWIQSVPGISGVLPQTPNQSSREVLGVLNNGEDNGTITFNVPAKNAQNFYYTLADAGHVDFATGLQFDQINNIYYSEFVEQYGGIDGITDINNRTIIFLNDAGWFYSGLFDNPSQPFGDSLYDETVEITLNTQKFSVWRITLVYDDPDNPYIKLTIDRPVNQLSKLLVEYGSEYSNISFYKTAEGLFERIPLITADLDYLYYQDADNPELFGVIKLVDQAGDQTLDIADIIGKKNYTSPNGVVFTNGLKVTFIGSVNPSSYAGKDYYVEGVGTAIELIPSTRLTTPETYTRSSTTPYDSTPFDVGNFDATLNAPLDPDYLTINRASFDYNAWSRSNRWFHIDVIYASASYNGVVPVVDNAFRAKRPILEFRKDLKLFDYGTQAIDPIDIIDFRETDALSNINGTIGYSVDGYTFINGSRVIFAADVDPTVRNKVYVVSFIDPDNTGVPVIDLQPADINHTGALVDQCTVCMSGVTLQGKSFYFDGVEWIAAQQKTSVNQAPLFDVFDENGTSFGDRATYPGTDFVGTKLFSYAVGTGTTDTIIGQPLKYLTINNVGDIVFDNNLYIDTFVYVKDSASYEQSINSGVIRQYIDRTNYRRLIGWQTAHTELVTRQSFSFEYDGISLILDVPVDTESTAIPVKVFVNGAFVNADTYTYTVTDKNTTVIVFNAGSAPAVSTLVEVSAVSKVASSKGFYSVPLNLENNAINADAPTLTLGTIRNHYGTICQNLKEFQGQINGANNTRDLGNIIPYGQIILQQSSPMTFASLFYNSQEWDFFRAIGYAAREYEKYKNLILDYVFKNDFQNMAVSEILDEAIAFINVGKTELSPFYWSDMLPCGSSYDETNYTVTPITTNTFDTLYSYDFTTANYKGLLVYLNGEILIGDDHEYSVATDGPRITILVPLTIGDVITIREYPATYGNYVPSTPTQLGLYPAWIPAKYLDDTYVEPTNVIRGHDGSITVAFNDIRDDVLLEFEKRVYDNLKSEHNYIPVEIHDVVPGQFRKTDYTQSEVTQILGTSFLAWVGTNKLDYRTQDYIPDNEFTWNYTSSLNKLDNSELLGAWRGIYEYFYDTTSPHTMPWEMLGITEKPDWWEAEYGPAPYTSGNLVLWEDLEAGLVKDPAGYYYKPEYARPGLTKVIPTGSEGQLLAPFNVMVGEYDVNSWQKSWTVGDDGPTENAWRQSSSYPFALMRLFALTKPAQFFALNIDRDLYRYNFEFAQWLYQDRYRIEPSNVQVYGDGLAKHSYVNWIVDYNRQTGVDSTKTLTTALDNIDVRLCYRMASFSDKQYLKIFTEKSSPNSLNTSLLLPDESYQLLLYKNPTLSTLTWSSVIVQKTEAGYAVYGYSTTQPYFEILTSVNNGNYNTVTVADTVVRVAKDYSNKIVQVPYGYEFTSINTVVDFLFSYGRAMEIRGMTFQDQEGSRLLNWNQMAQEFIYWSKQGWAPGSLINLNPVANKLNVFKDNLIVEPLSSTFVEDILLNQNKTPLKTSDYVVERLGNDFTLTAVNNQNLSYLYAKFTEFEHLIVFDNKSIFNDLIYDPATGARQSRLLLAGYTTYDWNGSLDAQGFILNQDNVATWVPNTPYSKGQIVKYKDAYWSAAKIIPPQEKFDFNVWIKSDYNKIQKGLLPNLATKSELFRNYYDIDSANLERDADLLSFGLIGFRPRQYMQNLNLDDISQVNVYSQFLKVKGTTQATDIFTRANLGKEVAEYEIFENWAIQRATYGANANRSYFELRLDESLLLGNPSTVEVVEPQQASTADQQILVNDIWKESYKITSPNILPTTTLTPADEALPSAGYVNWDDVDIKVFNFEDLTPIIDDIENITVGTSIWVAKSNSHDWNIYRTNVVLYSLISVKDNLNGKCTLTFEGQHGLSVGEKIIIKYFSSVVDGAYIITSVPSLKTATIELALPDQVTQIDGIGTCFVLESMRVAQASDVAGLEYSNSLLPGNRAWVDNDGTGNWAVYQKSEPFDVTTGLEINEPLENSRLGSAITQGFGNFGALVGAPGYDNGIGAVYSFNKSGTFTYVQGEVLVQEGSNFKGYGSSLASGSHNWGVAGAPLSWGKQGYASTIFRNPDSGSFIQSQLLTEVPYRLYTAIGNGVTQNFDPSSEFTITDPEKVGVVVNDVVMEYGVDWTYSAPNVHFTTAPSIGHDINIFLYDEYGYGVAISNDERWMYISAPSGNRVYAYNRVDVQLQTKNFVGDGSTIEFYVGDVIVVDDDSADGGIGQEQIGVTVNDLPKSAGTDYSYNSNTVTFAVPPNTGDQIRVIRKQSKSFIETTPKTVFDISELYTVGDIHTFSVSVDGVLQRPNMDYTFATVGSEKIVTFATGVIGTILFDSSTYFDYVDYFTVAGIDSDARLGQSITTTTDGRQIIVSASKETVGSDAGAGSVYFFDRTVEKFTVVDPTETDYTMLRAPNGPVSVTVNGTYLQPSPYNNNGQFTVSGNTVTILTTLNVGDIIEIENNTFNLAQTIQSNNSQEDGQFGYVVDGCPTNCSLYIGMPNDSSVLPEAGSVERWVNQSRLYGLITSVNQDPTLTSGDTVRINNVDIGVSTPTAWNSSIGWSANEFVIDGGTIYYSIQTVPVSTAITDTAYWQESSWLELFANDINVAATPVASGVNQGLVRLPNVSAIVSNGYLTVTIANHNAAVPFTQLQVLPGVGTAYDDIGFAPMYFAQTIQAPNQIAYAHFGKSVSISDDSLTLVVGSPQGTAAKPTTFDGGTTYFDSKATEFFDPLSESGVVYTYDLLSAANGSIYNPSKFVFGQQIYDETLQSLDEFGTAVSLNNDILLVGSPQDDLYDSVGDFGRVAQLNNTTRSPAWAIIYRQQPVVDVHLINSVYTYDRLESNVTQYFDFIDPLQGKILGSARQNIDYLGALDPAAYNTGNINNYGQQWTENHLGEIWWDLSTVRFIDYHQSTLQYASRRWGQLFPGSTVDIYQWIESPVPPAQYTGPGTPYSTTSYVTSSKLNLDGMFSARYFFWVKGIQYVDSRQKKTLSPVAIAQYIENPKSSGIPYIAALKPGAIALYNALPLLSAFDTIINIEFDKIANDDNVHVEYDLIASGNPESFLSGGLYRKMLDSFCGQDTLGNLVPDTTLSPADWYGVNFRPRQSFFVDRYLALENYLTRANKILAQYPISDSRKFTLLNSSEPEPTSASGEWNKRVADYAELTYQDLSEVPLGYKYLVVTDSTNDGLWTIYTVVNSLDGLTKVLYLSRVQNYDTRQYWNYINWVLPGYNTATKPVIEVPTYNDLLRYTVPEGSSGLVTANSYGKYEIYQYTNGEWNRVVLEDGTIEISAELWDYAVGRFGFDTEVFDAQRFDQAPITETRQVLKAINEELFIEELAIYRNELLMLVFEFILTEETAPDWLFKTSLIDVNHKIRDLLPYQVFRQDNQDFVLDYIKEVKPYHVKIKEFNLRYEGLDVYQGSLTDFDCPAYYDADLNMFVSPILDNTNPPISETSSRTSDDPIWQTFPWNQWYQNYQLILQSIEVIEGGSGYTVAPTVTITGDADVEATAVARVNTAGVVVEIIVLTPGSGYSTTPTITIEGGNGTGARAAAVTGNELVRNITTTIKYDRCEYYSTVIDWEPNIYVDEGALVRYNDKVWIVNQVTDSVATFTGDIFNPEQFTEADPATLNGADRTIGYYTPTPNEPGRELALLINGIDYPGVQVYGPDFSQNTGYDVGNFDINPFDNIDYGPEGQPTYDPAILDAIYESEFTDPYLGVLPAPAYGGNPPTNGPNPIIIAGGEFVDTYSSHAPEELIPGATFDTLDFRVYTRPGSDWLGNGHGFNIQSINLLYSPTDTTLDFSETMAHTVAVRVFNVSNKVTLIPDIDYTVDWANQTVTIIGGAATNDIISAVTYGVGGGSQLFKESYPGNLVGNTLIVPVNYSEIYDMLIVVNGEVITNYTYSTIAGGTSAIINFDDTYTNTDWVVVTVLGTATPQTNWSMPLTEYFTYDGSTNTFTLTNSVEGTNNINLIVERDGQRLRPAESAFYTGDGSGVDFDLPTRGKIPQGLVSDNDVVVYINQELQILSVDYTVSAWDGSSDRYVTFATTPADGDQIVIAVTTEADYYVNGNDVTLRVGAAVNATIAITTWNDTQEQGLRTQVFVGPTQTGTTVGEAYDETDFDVGLVTGGPGTFDYSTGTVVSNNNLDTGREITNSQRLWVTLNGYHLFPGEDFTVSGSVVTIGGSILGPGDVVAITSFTQSVVPEAEAFRIFQDMLGIQTIYRILPDTSTFLTQELALDDDIIYVNNAQALSQPNPEENIWGIIMINGERILYRERDIINNTVSSLRRGVAGTAVNTHAVDSVVTDIGKGQALPKEYQQTVYVQEFIGDGSTTTFTTELSYDNPITVSFGGTITVSEGPTLGTLVELPSSAYTVNSVEPIAVTLNSITPGGYSVRVTYTPTVGAPVVSNFSATGSSAYFATTTDISLVEQLSSTYTVDSIEPIAITFNTAVDDKKVVVINDLNASEFFIGDDSTTTFTTTIDIAQPVEVVVAGSLLAKSAYTVDSISPIVVTLNTAPSNKWDVDVYIKQAQVMYAQGINTASNGIPLQEQQTLAAWFIQGEV